MDSDRNKIDSAATSKVDYDALLDSITPETISSEVEFIGLEPFTVKTTNAMELYNHYQMYPKIIVFDLRDSSRYKESHLKCSVNFPINVFKTDNFINFNPEWIEKEHLELDVDKLAFKNRKRSVCFIVAHSTGRSKIFDYVPDLFDREKFDLLKTMFSAEDILATRNSFLLYKALKKDKTREVYFSLNSFRAIQGKYPFMCRFAGSSLYLDPKKTNGYPSEILDRRLYLGDSTHAGNQTIIHNLGITHILNVTDNIPNTFEESKTLKLTYQRINIEDNEDVPIQLSFSLAYDFIDKAISPTKTGKTRLYPMKFDVVQYFKDGKKASKSLVNSLDRTNDMVIDLGNNTVQIVKDAVKDKIYDIDKVCEYNMFQSNNQNRVLVH